MKYSLAIIGNKEAIIGFKTLGLKTYNALSTEKAVEIMYSLKSETITDPNTNEQKPAYAIIFITEDLAMNIPEEDYQKLSKDALPAIVPIPGSQGATGYGIKRLGKMVEQAVGSDILKD